MEIIGLSLFDSVGVPEERPQRPLLKKVQPQLCENIGGVVERG